MVNQLGLHQLHECFVVIYILIIVFFTVILISGNPHQQQDTYIFLY